MVSESSVVDFDYHHFDDRCLLVVGSGIYCGVLEMKKVAGFFLVCVPLIALFIFSSYAVGIYPAALIFGVAILCVACFYLGAWLLED